VVEESETGAEAVVVALKSELRVRVDVLLKSLVRACFCAATLDVNKGDF
jgi:hypothetical protein